MRNTKRSCERLALLAALALLLTGCAGGAAAEKHEKQLFAMDTVMFLTAYGEAGDKALAAATDVINGLAADLDPEKEGGSVAALNAGAGGAVAVSEDCLAVLDAALAVGRETGGALDPALYPIIRAWGFTTGEYRVPDQSELAALLEQKHTEAIRLDTAAGTVTLPEDMAVSLGAAAKGYAAQKAVEAMAAAGAEQAILSLGGNVQTLGQTRPDGSPWQVAVTDPRDTGAYVGTLSVGQTAVVTSGGYQRFFEQDGRTYIHILDPATGCPVENDLLSVTVVTADGTRADGLSTALFVLGAEAALDYAAAHEDVELVLITRDDRVIVTAGLAEGFTEAEEAVYTYEYP